MPRVKITRTDSGTLKKDDIIEIANRMKKLGVQDPLPSAIPDSSEIFYEGHIPRKALLYLENLDNMKAEYID